MIVLSVATYVLYLKVKPTVLIDLRHVTPDRLAGKEISEIRDLSILEGGKKTCLSEIFEISGPSRAPKDPASINIVIEGGSDKLCYVGYKMSSGNIMVKGNVGHLVGYKMRGGKIIVKGNARNYVGAKMKGGTIEIHGNVGHRLGSKLVGEKPGKGMRNGTIIVHGNAGSEVGVGMKRGLIMVEGSAGNLVGADMSGGTIIIKENCGLYPGVGMLAGKIVIGKEVGGILPSFYVDSLLPSIKVKGIVFNKQFMLFFGDAVVNGKGLLYISYEDNKALLEHYRILIKEEGVEI